MATIKDVAKYAGVSVATVSRVLNQKGPLSDKAIEKVQEAVEVLNYRPNLFARSLASGRNNSIGVIIPSLNTPIWSELAQAIENYARENRYHVIFSVVSSNDEERFEAVEYLRTRQVNGIIFGGSMWGDTRLVEKLQQMKDFPLAVLLDQVDSVPCVVSDDAQGGLLAARHLIARGCKNIVHVSANLNIYKHSDERSYAFMEECKKRGVKYRIYENSSTMPGVDEAQTLINRILYEDPAVDGMFLKNDILAAECISYALSQGMRIPDDLRIVGYDDMYFSSLIYPPLTTIRHNYRRLAKETVDCVLSQIEGKAVSELEVIPVDLIERKTT